MTRGRPKKTNELEALVRTLEDKKEQESKKKKTISVTLSPDLLEDFDLLAIDYTNGNRSELLEKVLNAFVIEAKKEKSKRK